MFSIKQRVLNNKKYIFYNGKNGKLFQGTQNTTKVHLLLKLKVYHLQYNICKRW